MSDVGGKKAKKGRLPKEILGVKLPKELRKAGDELIGQAGAAMASAAGRQAIAGALTVAAAAASAAIARKAAEGAAPAPAPSPAAAGPGPETGDAAAPQGTQRAPDPQAVADAVVQAADAVLGRLFGKRA
ncbi:hypothetical protein [Sphingomonas sp. CCH9-F2]|uniref:hypothetical protein n=1 Tax=Sphingomonas sp. CCH9-F2 TaxID=1768778 RepID=UPI000829551D|nr:hypothetical protein [Sphingomonas sp. CCH9-F2]